MDLKNITQSLPFQIWILKMYINCGICKLFMVILFSRNIKYFFFEGESLFFEGGKLVGSGKNKKVEPLFYLFSLKLTNLTKPKLMKKNVIQM